MYREIVIKPFPLRPVSVSVRLSQFTLLSHEPAKVLLRYSSRSIPVSITLHEMSSIQRKSHHELRCWSADEFESVMDSEEAASSVIRLPRVSLENDAAGLKPKPPPLPPKPGFARASAFPSPGSPPPLPPKPDNVRGEKLADFTQTNRFPVGTAQVPAPASSELSEFVQVPSYTPPPTRPPPPIPRSDRKPSYGEEGSWVPSNLDNLDERSQVDPPQPPEPTIISDWEPIKSSVGINEASTQSLTDQQPSLTLPLPPPPYTAQDHNLSSLFPPVPSSSEHEEQDLADKFVFLSAESAEDSEIGALVLSRERHKRKVDHKLLRPSPIQWQLYTRREPGGEIWSVLHEYLTNTFLKVKGRNRALQLLTGYVVGACLASTEAGTGLLSEIVRRMRGAERSERDGSIFTLLLNIGAHASFVHRSSWVSVEEVARKVFSNVVEEMHGRQDDDVMWERALRCYLVLLRSSNKRPSDQISSSCLAALSLHIGDLTHTDVDHVLITEGLCPRLQRQRDDMAPAVNIDYNCLEQIGGIETVLMLYADTASLSARHSLFRVMYDFAVLKCLEGLSTDDIEILKDHIVTFRALLETYEMADCFVHTFRVGPWPEFVMDTIRAILFYPLCTESQDSLIGRTAEDIHNSGAAVLQEKTESLSLSDTRLSGTIGRAYRTSATKHLDSIRAMVKLLDKPFCLRVLRQLQGMAEEQACLLSQREAMHFAREWKILCDLEIQLRRFFHARHTNTVGFLAETLTKMCAAAVDMTSGRSNLRGVLKFSEMVIEFFTVRPPFSRGRAMVPQTEVDSTCKMFLKGRLLVSRELLGKIDPSIFTLLLNATKTKIQSRRLSECRQCLVEILGSTRDNDSLLQTFVDDDDAAVGYRASELLSKFTDVNLQLATPGVHV